MLATLPKDRLFRRRAQAKLWLSGLLLVWWGPGGSGAGATKGDEDVRQQLRQGTLVFVALVLMASMAAALAGCGVGSKKAEPTIAVYAYNSEPVIFWDPSDTFSNEITTINNVYEPLLRYDPSKDEVTPVLCESYKVSEDGLEWTFNLRKKVKFHCGDVMTAKDVKYSIERTISRGKGASFIWAPVSEITTPDDYTVVFKLKYPAPLDMIASAGYTSHVFCAKHTEEYGSDWFAQGNDLGTGPYKVESWKRGDEVVLAKFDDYWGGWGKNSYDKAIIKMVPEASTRRQMLESGEAHFLNNTPFEDIEAMKSNPNVVITVAPSFQNLFVLMNTAKAPLNDKKVRQALSYAFPYGDVIEYVMHGYATQSKGAVPKGLWGHNENLFQYSHDLEKAGSLLAEAGYSKGGLKLLLTYTAGDENERKAAELYKAELTKLGIDLEIRGMPWDAQWEMAKSRDPKDRQDMFMFYWWPDYADPYSFLRSIFHSEQEIVFNLCYWSNPEYDSLIDEANKIAGPERQKAIELYGKAQEILVEEAPAIFVFDQQYVRAVHKSFKGFVDNPAYPHVVFFHDVSYERK